MATIDRTNATIVNRAAGWWNDPSAFYAEDDALDNIIDGVYTHDPLSFSANEMASLKVLLGTLIARSKRQAADRLETAELDFTAGAADVLLAVPSGYRFFIDSIHVVSTNIAGLTAQPTIRAGVEGTPAKYLAAVQTTLLTAAHKREKFTALLADDGETGNLSVGWTASATGTTVKGKIIIVGTMV